MEKRSQCILIILLSFAIHANGEQKLPHKIWPAIRVDKTYHLVFQMQSLGMVEKLTIEEWSSFNDETFRLDLISPSATATYLTNGKSKEIFRYEPFTCNLLEPDSKDLQTTAAIFRGFGIGPASNHIYAYGLGPLWLRAEQDAESVVELDLKSKDADLYQEGLSGYEVSFAAQSDLPYNLRFYFKKEQKNPFIAMVEWVDKVGTVLYRARVVDLDLREQSSATFDLPIGHGCQRGKEFDHPIKVQVGLEILHDGTPNQAVFEVTTSKPRDYLLHSWETESYTVRISRGGMKLNGKNRVFYSTLLQKRDPDTLRLRRTKQVWSGFEDSNQAVVYTIDKETGECSVSHQDFKDHVKLVFPGQEKMVKPLLISSDTIASIFNDNNGYHLIKEVAYPNTDNIRKATYEKRVKDYEIKTDGVVVWKGPVSIVKEFTGPMFKLVGGQDESMFFSHMSVVQTLFLYSEDYKDLLYKTVFNLVGADQLDTMSFHQQLDISTCFSIDEKEEVIIKYPIESRGLVNGLMSVQNLVHERFIENLFTTTSILPQQVSGVQLTFDNFFMHIRLTLIDLPLTQTYEFEPHLRLVNLASPNKSGFLEKFTANANKCGVSCSHYNCYRFSYEFSNSRCRLELSQGSATTEPATTSDLWTFSPVIVDSEWGQYEDSDSQYHLSPQQVVSIFRSSIGDENAGNTDDRTISSPLVFSVLSSLIPEQATSSDPKLRVWFYPISVLSDIDSMNEFEREQSADAGGGNTMVVRFKDHHKFGVEYSVARESRSFVSFAPGNRYTEVYNYEDCARYCEDNNCKSFSYCDLQKVCFVTKLSKTSEMQSILASETHCTVYTIDYLSKFENFGRVVPPATVKQSHESIGEQECASICLNEEQINCQAFYHCSGEGIQATCLLDDRHIEEIASSLDRLNRVKFYDKSSDKDAIKGSNRECRLYSRSYLSQFDEYHEKGLSFGSQESEEAEIVFGEGAEKCAQSCIERSCLAFDVCFDPNSADRKLKHVCKLAKKTVRKSHLESRKKCTTFVLSDRSQFNVDQVSLIAEKPDQRALDKVFDDKRRVTVDPDEKKMIEDDINAGIFSLFPGYNRIQIIDSSHWTSKLFSMIFGIFLGVCCAFLWKGRDDIYNRVTSLSNRFAR